MEKLQIQVLKVNITLVENVDNDMVTVDSTIVTNGKFTFKGETESPALRFIH